MCLRVSRSVVFCQFFGSFLFKLPHIVSWCRSGEKSMCAFCAFLLRCCVAVLLCSSCFGLVAVLIILFAF